jgi:hypothetical protein
MPERVTTGRLGDSSSPAGFFDGSLQDRFVKMMPLVLAGLPITIELRGGKDPLPSPFFGGAGRKINLSPISLFYLLSVLKD